MLAESASRLEGVPEKGEDVPREHSPCGSPPLFLPGESPWTKGAWPRGCSPREVTKGRTLLGDLARLASLPGASEVCKAEAERGEPGLERTSPGCALSRPGVLLPQERRVVRVLCNTRGWDQVSGDVLPLPRLARLLRVAGL